MSSIRYETIAPESLIALCIPHGEIDTLSVSAGQLSATFDVIDESRIDVCPRFSKVPCLPEKAVERLRRKNDVFFTFAVFRDNIDEFFQLLDSGRVATCDVVCCKTDNGRVRFKKRFKGRCTDFA